MSLPNIWRPSQELLADARAAKASGDAATACRLAFAATMHASTRGADGNTKYVLSDDAVEAAMAIFTGAMNECDFAGITQLVNDEIASDRERPATGLSASRDSKRKEQRQQAALPLPVAEWAFQAGQRVRIEGLTSRSDLNGCYATVLSFDADKDKYAVRVDTSDECVRLSTNRVVALAAETANVPVSSLVDAASAGKSGKLRRLIRQGGDVNGTGHGRSGNPVAGAAAHGHLECLRLLLDAGARPDMPNGYGSTPMHDAAYHGELGCVVELLKRGAAADSTDANGSTPLVAACAAGHVNVVKALLEHHACITQAAFGANRAGSHGNQEAIEAALLRTATAGEPRAAAADEGQPRQHVGPEPDPASEQLPLSSICTIHGVQSKPELNGDFAVVESPPDGGRYQVAVPLGRGKALRIKLKGLSLTPAPADASTKLDPRELPMWPGLSCGSEVRFMDSQDCKWTSCDALAYCFQKAIPPGAKMSLSGPPNADAAIAEVMKMRPELGEHKDNAEALALFRKMLEQQPKGDPANLTPHAQWMWSLNHLVHDYQRDEPAGSFRFLLAHAASASEIKGGGGSAECLIIDVLAQPLACPRQLPANHTQWAGSPDGKQKEGLAMCEPLLSVRYWYIYDDDPSHSKRKATMGVASPSACAFTRAAIAAKGHVDLDVEAFVDCIQAESLLEVRSALAMLEANHKVLSTEYRAFFDAASPYHGEGQFRASFLVPARHPRPVRKGELVTCAGCGAKQADADPRFKTCARCETHFYCSAACQKQHWKAHKKVCDKTADEIRALQPSGGRPSVVFSAVPPAILVGKYMLLQNYQGAPGSVGMHSKVSESKSKVEAKAPKNVYGAELFVVKVQPPGNGHGDGPYGFASRADMESDGRPWACMVYDEPRTLSNVYLPLDTPGIEAALKLICRDGIRVASGAYKAYFEAVREGTCLRIYTDRLAPQPGW